MTKPIWLFSHIYFGMRNLSCASYLRVKSISPQSNVNLYFLLDSYYRKFSLSSKFISLSNFENVNSKNSQKNNPNENSIIYYGELTGKIKFVKIFSYASSLGGIFIQPFIMQNLMSGALVPPVIALEIAIVFFTFITPLLIHMIAKKYVTEINYNSTSDTYTATTLSFFLRRINVEFKLNDVTIPHTLPLFTTLFLKNKPVFIDSESFLLKNHYIKLMGYDKPMDLRMSKP